MFCGIEFFEGEEVLKYCTEMLGDGVLMYQSDYPHAQCKFPDSPGAVLAWDGGLTQDQRVKLFSGNAERYMH